VVFQLGVLGMGLITPHRKKICLLRNVIKGLGLGWKALVNTAMNLRVP
jgi:hypothetical protein